MPALRTIPLAAALLVPLFIGGAATATAADLSAPTNTADISVTHQQQPPPLPVVTGIRLGRNAGYDRLVYDISGAMPNYSAGYVPAVHSGNGTRVSIRGKAVLAVSLHSVDTTHPPAVPGPANLPTIRDIKVSDQFEGYLNYNIGVSDRNGFRVFELSNPTRLVIDIAHDLPAPTSTQLQSSPLGDDHNANLTAIRTGAHLAYDRVVFDFTGPDTGLRYVVGYQDGTLLVDLGHGTLRDPTGTLTYTGQWTLHPHLTQLTKIQITRASADGTTIALTPRHTTGFRVLLLRSPERIIVDLAH